MLKPICDATFVISALVLQYICHACSCSAVHFHTCSCSAVHLSYLLLFCSTFSYLLLFCSIFFIPALVLQYICHTCSCSAVYFSYLLLFCSIFVMPALVLQYVSLHFLKLSYHVHVKVTGFFYCILFLLSLFLQTLYSHPYIDYITAWIMLHLVLILQPIQN